MAIPRVLGIPGSLRAGSLNRRLLEAATDELWRELREALEQLPVARAAAVRR